MNLEGWLWSAVNHLQDLCRDDYWDKETVSRCITADLERVVSMVKGKLLVTPVTHEKDGMFCTTFPTVYGVGATAEESRKVFEQRSEEVERR